MAIEKARRSVAKFLDCSNEQIIFNSGSTEGISSVFLHTYFKYKETDRNIILISDTEHAAPLNEAKFLEGFGFKSIFIPTLNSGEIDFNFLKEQIHQQGDKIALTAVMAANNETGVIQPYKNISKLCAEKNIPYLCDTTQILGKADFSFKDCGADYITLSGHKLGALPGVGALIIKDPANFVPTIHGGNQENGLRGGTQNYVGIETIGVAVQELMESSDCHDKVLKLRDNFEHKILEAFPQINIFGKSVERICNTSFLSLPGSSASDIQDELQLKKIYVTTSSACSDQNGKTSRILNLMGVNEHNSSGAVRISFCSSNSSEDYDFIFNTLCEIFEKIK